ncbi:MAG: cytochrome-c oxidase, cbb3-type subunit I [Deltaproteobacteria bacterium]|nr:cytochrome-c oxidase, cbb3-type subunit I [Deltaproteobacteria bacterium]
MTVETFRYDDAVVRKFAWATVLWAIVGMLVGVIVALQIAWWPANAGLPWLTFGRLRPLHTNAVIFAFAGNAIFAGMYYSTQRLLKTRMLSDALSNIHFWGWQLIIVSAAVTLPLGITTSKEYAELEWPIDVSIAAIWVVFAVNFFGAIWKRRERHLYVAIWFYIATILTVAMLHIVNSLALPVSFLKSYSVYAGVQDALVQWWYGHNAVAFFLTTPFLGLMYYFMPKAAERPVYSYKLSIIHFWALVFLYIWAGPHHLLYTALPEWAQTLGMVFSLMLIAPSWGGMINGLLTLRGAWDKLRTDPVVKFMVVAITFYGVATFEGPMLAIKKLNMLSHYTDWTIAHVHAGALGWNGFLSFGMLYWLIPRLYKRPLHSIGMANAHFWVGLLGMVFYIVSMWSAGITQGLMWFAFDESGYLAYPTFMETVTKLQPFYWLRTVGGTLYLTGVIIAAVNLILTVKGATVPEDTEAQAAPLPKTADDTSSWHGRLEGKPLLFSVLSLVAVLVGTFIEFVPMMAIESNVPSIAAVKPYTPLELEGRDIYIREGCYNCHSQMIRPIRAETERYGDYSKAGEFVYDHPFQFGSKRTGPDLHRIGGKYPHLWHYNHMRDPRSTTAESIMPPYPWLLEDELDTGLTKDKVSAMRTLGVPYSDADVDQAVDKLEAQRKEIGDALAKDGIAGAETKEIVALIAYLQRLGTDTKPGAVAAAK